MAFLKLLGAFGTKRDTGVAVSVAKRPSEFIATVGAETATHPRSSTLAVRAAAARHFGVDEGRVEFVLTNGSLRVRKK